MLSLSGYTCRIPNYNFASPWNSKQLFCLNIWCFVVNNFRGQHLEQPNNSILLNKCCFPGICRVCFLSQQASYLWLHPTPAKMQIRNVTKKENQPKQIVFWSFLLFCPPLLFTDRESENESVKSFPASTLFDQIKLCVLFDWNWIVVKGQGGENIRSTCASSIFDSKST